MPIGDWQFWAVSLIAVASVAIAGRALFPARKRPKTPITVSAPPKR